MLENQAETIFVELNRSVFNEMIEESTKWHGKETGGMMFGKIYDNESGLLIKIVKTYIPSVEESIRNNTYFEINPEYARLILDTEKLLYLGNWHKHLGYGGPSYGDHQQIREFFTLNPHKNTVVSLIIDLPIEDTHTVIAEVYRREKNEEGTENTFQTFRIAESNISYYSEDVGITKEQLSPIKRELIQVFESKFKIEDIHHFFSTPNEAILSFPYDVVIETEEHKKTLELLILISFPPEFPEDQIYIDISSQDLSQRFTIEKHPANVLYEEELINPFLELLKATLEEKISNLLKEPLWKLMVK
ncbi:MAG: Mov34/MPN/PAD-1 family protein [Candidatus Heimdallarchaeota archaeon]|nr:MAG: Mov34/MPN/PAD-1 family protein [Candidatus Heimdallarchaeota archaeon]